MRYMGGKHRLAKSLAAIFTEHRDPGQCYVEPFVGAVNVIIRMRGWRIGSDIESPLIELWKKVRDGWIPPTLVSEDEWRHIKLHQANYPPELVAFAGYGCSFGGKFFGGYARGREGGSSFSGESSRGCIKKREGLQGVELACSPYDEITPPPKSLIYCDPPYQGRTSYQNKFDSDKFWQWCRDRSDDGHNVFVSELQAPDDFKIIWEKDLKSRGLRSVSNQKQVIERLYSRSPG